MRGSTDRCCARVSDPWLHRVSDPHPLPTDRSPGIRETCGRPFRRGRETFAEREYLPTRNEIGYLYTEPARSSRVNPTSTPTGRNTHEDSGLDTSGGSTMHSPYHRAALTLTIALAVSAATMAEDTPPVPRWSVEKANQWYQAQPWPVGCNYIPSTAVNQIETWQAESFDPQTIDRELGWAEDLGFNTVRIFLHDLVWEADPAGFKDRLGQFLDICQKHHIRAMVTFFTNGCYGNAEEAHLGKQPAPGARRTQFRLGAIPRRRQRERSGEVGTSWKSTSRMWWARSPKTTASCSGPSTTNRRTAPKEPGACR